MKRNLKIEIGDLVSMPPRKGSKHRSRGIVKGITRKHFLILPLPRHRCIEKFLKASVKLSASDKIQKLKRMNRLSN